MTKVRPGTKGNVAIIGLAEIDLDTGNPAAALEGLHQALQKLPELDTAPQRWIPTLEIAPLLAAAGKRDQAERLTLDVLPDVQRAGGRPGRTRIVPRRCRRRATAARDARGNLPEAIWMVDQRIDMVEAGLARLDGEPERTTALLLELEREAASREDVLVQLRALSAIPAARARSARMSLVARTGLRGVSSDWMMPKPSADTLKGNDTP